MKILLTSFLQTKSETVTKCSVLDFSGEDHIEVPRELWLKAGAEGLLCCTVPEKAMAEWPRLPWGDTPTAFRRE
ncbi:MAG: hypothetical protein ACXWKP_20380, partial [Bradyrhizobium sp.]